MKNGIFLMFTMLLLQNVYGQQNTFFDMEPKHTQRKLREYKEAPVLYGLVEKKFKYVTAAPKKRIENKEYKELETQITALEKDSIQSEADHLYKLDKFSQVGKIKVLIDDFLTSPKPYEIKKDKLISAQKIAGANGITELIYADSSINSSFKSKFFVLQLNKLDLKVHLKKVNMRLSQLDLVEPVKKPSSLIDHRLKDLRSKKSGLKRYKYITSKPKTTFKNGLAVTNKLNISGSLKGEFKQIGKYYIAQSDYKGIFKKGQVLSIAEVKKHNLSDKGYVGPLQVLIQNVGSKVKYITKDNFLNRYAFSINGKFNRTGSTATVYTESGRSYSNRN